ncbi:MULTISPECIES: alpha/beta fold hydrolase [unclassified Haladaptatus]|uniref:alpha/beta fold hydrolase n=1 Tax=unclassified Haladaptatus TaxID=2622732 RepID=UPI0023E89D44|nr:MULTISPECIES: alpha/beta hydrolase [unclassified Haladaptatus]
MKTVSHHGRETAYRRTDFGDAGQPICYVHGSGGTHRVWTGIYGRRANTRPAVALDLSGHGESDDIDAEPGFSTLAAYADDVLAVVEETGASVLVGNSLGGAVILHLLVERDVELEAAVLAGTGAKLSVLDDLLRWLDDDYERAVEFLHGEDMLFHDTTSTVVDHSKATMNAVGSAVTERDFRTCHRFDVRDQLDNVETPTLALVGEYDRLTPVSYHEYLVEHMPNATLAMIEDAAHLAMIEQPAAFANAIERFLAQ